MGTLPRKTWAQVKNLVKIGTSWKRKPEKLMPRWKMNLHSVRPQNSGVAAAGKEGAAGQARVAVRNVITAVEIIGARRSTSLMGTTGVRIRARGAEITIIYLIIIYTRNIWINVDITGKLRGSSSVLKEICGTL